MLSYRSSTEQTQYTQTSSDQTTGSDSMDRWVLDLNRKEMDLVGFDSMVGNRVKLVLLLFRKWIGWAKLKCHIREVFCNLKREAGCDEG